MGGGLKPWVPDPGISEEEALEILNGI